MPHHCDNEHDEHDELWELLGRAPKAGPTPFFTRRVLRQVREEASRPRACGWWQGIFAGGRGWAAGAAIAAVVVMAALTGVMAPWQSGDLKDARTSQAAAGGFTPDSVFPATADAAIDYFLIADVDAIVAFEEKALWAEYSLN